MKRKKNDLSNSVTASVAVILLAVVIGIVYFFPDQIRFTLSTIRDASTQFASLTLSHNFRTVAQIKKNYELASLDPATKKVRILVVPGHDPNSGGAEFKGVKERDLAVEVGQNLKQFFQNDTRYEVMVARDTSAWSPVFATYFKNNWEEIKEWRKTSRDEFSYLVDIGSITRTISKVYHDDVPSDIAVQLYGITKWSNENDVDIVIHIHFNDNPRPKASLPGTHSGFTIYVPAEQYGNSTTTKVIANNIFKRLEKYNPVSSLPGESTGVVDEPELIAIGANNTSDAASMLIEYSYIYEPQLQDPQIRSLITKDFAYETFLGLHDFFDPTVANNLARPYDTLVLPYSWKKVLTQTNASPQDIFALQTALMVDGVYPPDGKNNNDCPRTGIFGPCTRSALKTFQTKRGISDEKGIVGDKTLIELKKLY